MAEGRATAKSRILVVDDHPVVRQGLLHFINQQEDLVGCGEASNSAEALRAIALCHPDLAIVDVRLKNEDGLELIKQLKAGFPELRILMLSQYDLPLYAERALRAGALGFVIKAQAADEILTAIRSVLAGDIYLPQALARLLLHQLIGAAPNANRPSVENLTDRELHVLRLLGAGRSTREIAVALELSFKTVETHRENIKHKLGLQGANQLIHFATEWARQQTSPTHPEPPEGSTGALRA
jgi:DNA-binding NarL/FixJ family response regulator